MQKKIPDDIRFKRGLLSAKHITRMGSSVWLYLFFLDRQTDANGLVWYGRPITYEWISTELGGFSKRRLRRWNERLQASGSLADLTSCQQQLKDAGAKLSAAEKERDDWKTAAKGGTWAKRIKSGAIKVGIGIAIGVAADRAAHH